MSTILKALRRLEEEKASAESGRPLREQIAATAPSPPESSGRSWVAAVLALLFSALAGGGVIWWMFGDERTAKVEQVAAAPVAEAPATTVRQATPRPAPAAPAPVVPKLGPTEGPPEDAFASDVDVVRRPERAPRLADTNPVKPKSAPKAGARRPVEDSVAMARANAQAQAELDQLAEMDRLIAETESVKAVAPPVTREPDPQPAPEPIREPAPAVAKAEPAPKPVAVKPKPAPVAPKPKPEPAVVAAAPEPKRAPAPTPEPVAAPEPEPVAAPEPEPAPAPALAGLLVERTTWHPSAARRSAWLRVGDEAAPREVVEGDVVDGVIVAEIQPSGVVFERDGASTRRGVGEK